MRSTVSHRWPEGLISCQLEGRVPSSKDTPLTGLWNHLLRSSKDKSHFHNYSPGNLSSRFIFTSSGSGIPVTLTIFPVHAGVSLAVFLVGVCEMCYCFAYTRKYVLVYRTISVACDYNCFQQPGHTMVPFSVFPSVALLWFESGYPPKALCSLQGGGCF